MSSLERAQLGEIGFMTMHSEDTVKDTVCDLRAMAYEVPSENVLEMLTVIATGVTEA